MSGAGALNQRVTIEHAVRVADGLGGEQVHWEALASCFAEVVPVNSVLRERNVADQVTAMAGYRVRLRTRDDVDASMRVQWRGHVLHIHALHDDGAMMTLLTYEEQV